MPLPPQIWDALAGLDDFRDDLRALFDRMDAAYDRTAREVDFVCRGCRENCCYSRFYHHTWLETLTMVEGFRQLAADQQALISQRAGDYVKEMHHTPEARPLCPLNQNERCGLYAHRPMICRLHGVGHVLQRPAGPALVSSGCDVFASLTSGKQIPPLDRTPLYLGLAGLEKRFVERHHLKMRPRLTVAEMIRLSAQLYEEGHPGP